MRICRKEACAGWKARERATAKKNPVVLQHTCIGGAALGPSAQLLTLVLASVDPWQVLLAAQALQHAALRSSSVAPATATARAHAPWFQSLLVRKVQLPVTGAGMLRLARHTPSSNSGSPVPMTALSRNVAAAVMPAAAARAGGLCGSCSTTRSNSGSISQRDMAEARR